MNLTFDGQECVHEGPESIAAGEVRLTLVNKSDVPTFLAALKLHDGKTLEDVVSYLATTARDVPGWDTVPQLPRRARIGGNRELTAGPWELRDGVPVRSGSIQRLARGRGRRRRVEDPEARHRDGLQDEGLRGLRSLVDDSRNRRYRHLPEGDCVGFNHRRVTSSEHFIEDPYPVYHRLQHEAPVYCPWVRSKTRSSRTQGQDPTLRSRHSPMWKTTSGNRSSASRPTRHRQKRTTSVVSCSM